ncbi:alpha/beta hydrolase [Streptomyces sp. RLB1-33]|uniref:alpha/beta fold hydrolase n=1 Tax=Streptomyces mirabilis TaxID=68239 RepID=UPI00143E6409|nr:MULTISPECIES: alpha/beta hydrolase [Streptomyces]QIY68656.1 alpha/beta hydrolase [Streptomyces sp. RLB1-33]QUW84579.1 alpha/beta hydrolase [Streptomyces mirabilis]
MPYVNANGVRLAYERSGRGENVLLVMGSGAAGHVWTMHQTPALHRAGYGTVVFDNRGISPSDVPPGKYSLADMVADTRGLIEALDLAPCRIVGLSMGALIAQELAIDHPQLVRSAVLIATKARSDAARRAQAAADIALLESGVRVPAEFEAGMTVLQMLSPATLNDDKAVSTWLSVFELSHAKQRPASGQAWIDTSVDRRAALRGVTAPCRVIAFADDLVTPPHLAAEVAEAIPDCDYVEIPRCGHLGHLEQPDAVNAAITEFLDRH